MSTPSNKDENLAVRQLTAAHCAVALRDTSARTISEVAHQTGLSRPTVEAALRLLTSNGIVHASPSIQFAQTRGAGRPARSFQFNAAVGYCAGVDVGIHSIRVALADSAGRIVGWSSQPIPFPMTGATRLSAVKRALNDCLRTAGAPKSKLLALGIAVTGLVGPDGRIVLSRNLADWKDVDLAGHLNTEFDCQVIVDNDIRVAALAEHRMGAALLARDVIYFSFGHRVSMGLIIDGQLRRGRHSAAGEVGETIMLGGLNDDFGQLKWCSAPDGKHVFRLAGEGDAAAQAEVERFIERISIGIATITMAIDPDVVVIGGGLSQAGEALLEPLRRAVSNAIPLPVTPTIIASALGAEAVALGAMINAFGHATRSLFGVSGVKEPTIDYSSKIRDGSVSAT